MLVNRIFSVFHIYVVRSLVYTRIKRPFPVFDHDYIRIQTLELCAEEILRKNVKGHIAELGVYRGNFASKLNQLFPERTLYLFDTFTGFDERDTLAEGKMNAPNGKQRFIDTSPDFVLRKMKKPKQCIVKKGYFPETISGINTFFAFVSIDVDLYRPTMLGLEYFYPRLSNGGYIFVHDFYNEEYKGVREAVNIFCRNNNISFVPLPDVSGTAIITK